MVSELVELFEPYVWAWFTKAFAAPSPPQRASWPRIAKGENTLIFSPTGSGKTLAAFLWCLNELFKLGRQQRLEDRVYVLYVSPLKALNNDIQKNLIRPLQGIKAMAAEMGIDVPDVRSAVRTGDTTQKQRAAMVRRPPHILITTPESLYIILSTAKFREAFRGVRYVIVDEIHAISDNKRGVHLALSLERLRHLVQTPPAPEPDADSSDTATLPFQSTVSAGAHDFVRIGLSATQNPLEEISRFLVGQNGNGIPRPCEIVDVGGRKNLDVSVVSPVDNLLEAHFDAIWGSVYDRLLRLIRGHETTLVFANSRYKTERTALRLTELAGNGDVNIGSHHGSMSKRVRLSMENQLKRGDLDALVSTSSLELGIDVGTIDLVCQIQSPKSVSSGMQRIGRSGHLLDATSKGRLLVVDRDDLVESTVLVRAILDGSIDKTRVPQNCLDVLAQHIVGAVAADPWDADALYDLCRRAYCYHALDRADYDRVLSMLTGDYEFDMEYPPYPKITWDRVNNVLYPEPGARMIAFRSGGTIPDIAEYDVYFESRKTVVGRLGESFVEELHGGDIFILGNASWRVIRIHRNRVIVEDVYGKAPTIPFWFGDRASRTYELGQMVGAFRRHIATYLPAEDSDAQAALLTHLQDHYRVNERGARAIAAYLDEQRFVTGDIPSEKHLMVEHFRDELGQRQVVIHSPFGVRVHDPWALVLSQAIEVRYGVRPVTATTDDGILLTFSAEAEAEVGTDLVEAVVSLLAPADFERLLEQAVMEAPMFKSRFRHNAVRSMMVLRTYKGRRTPVWLQGLRASTLLEACQDYEGFPLLVETLRECTTEAMDVPNLRNVIADIATGDISVSTVGSKVPSPFTHTLLLLGQYGEMGSIPTQERRGRLMHLHRELLRQILDEETLRHLLDEQAVDEVENRLQRRGPKLVRNANELARLLLELGDMVTVSDEEMGLVDRVAGDVMQMLDELASERRIVLVPISTAETHRDRWIATENFHLYRAAFGSTVHMNDEDEAVLDALRRNGPMTASELSSAGVVTDGGRLDRLVRDYRLVRVVRDWRPAYVAADAWVPAHISEQTLSRQEARLALIRKYARWHGPFTKYDIMERYGLPGAWVEEALSTLLDQEALVRGEYIATKSFPQWCYRPNLEAIHRRTLQRLRKETEPATPEAYADFSMRWHHLHPGTQLHGIEGLRTIIRQIQGHESYQIIYEQDVFSQRLDDYDPMMLDRLIQTGEVVWRRFGYTSWNVRRGQIGFCFRGEQSWLVPSPQHVEMKLNKWDDDIPEVCDAVRNYLRGHGASFFDDIVAGIGVDWRYVLRAVWHLAWTGEATNDSYESIRHARVASGLSGCYDLATRPTKKGVTIDFIVRHMLENKRLDPRLGRWAPTERLVLPDPDPYDPEVAAGLWADQLLLRYGFVTKEIAKREVNLPPWRDLRRALAKKELLGEVRRGYFIEGLSGEQYARQEAVDALQAAKLRQIGQNGADQTSASDLASEFVLVNLFDPANPFGTLFPISDEVGNEIKLMKTPTKYLVLQQGRPVLLFTDRITLLADLSRDEMEAVLRCLMSIVDDPVKVERRTEISVGQWNNHPTAVSPARHLLVTLGFYPVKNRWKGYVYDGETLPDGALVKEAEGQLLDVYERAGKEADPVVYDADWVIAQAHEVIRPKVRELIDWLQARIPPECETIYRPRYFRDFQILYRGMRCINPHIQQKQIRLQIKFKGWSPGILIDPKTDLSDPEFVTAFETQFAETRAEIDGALEEMASRTACRQ